MTNKQAIKVFIGMEYMPLNRKSEDVQSASTLAINALIQVDELKAENATLKKALELAYQEANNAIYFSDSSDYLPTLYDVCKAIKPDVDPDEIGTEFME